MRRGLISLGDAVRATAALRPDADAADEMLRMLGLERAEARHEAPLLGVWKASSTANVLAAQRHSATSGADLHVPADLPPADSAQQTTADPPRAATLTPLGGAGTTVSLPEWASGEALVLEDLGPARPPDPLFGRIQRRGILSAALATPAPEGELDVDEAIARLARLEPIRTLPRRLAPTLRRGVQLLLDIGAGMLPFLEDQRSLTAALDDILSDDRLDVLYFAGCPSRGVGHGGRDEWRAWRPPPPGTPVLAVTDLGIGGPRLDDDRAGVAEWLAFAQHATAEGHRLLALVPHQATRWPPRLERVMTLIHWSERTTVAPVRRAVREGRR